MQTDMSAGQSSAILLGSGSLLRQLIHKVHTVYKHLENIFYSLVHVKKNTLLQQKRETERERKRETPFEMTPEFILNVKRRFSSAVRDHIVFQCRLVPRSVLDRVQTPSLSDAVF